MGYDRQNAADDDSIVNSLIKSDSLSSSVVATSFKAFVTAFR
jgi:hypothetical protein